MEPTLRLATTVEAVDPLSLAPNPGSMGQLYIDVRQTPEYPEGYADGMSLACAIPLHNYEDIIAAYDAQRYTPGFSPRAFWDANFETPDFSQQNIIAPDGMDIDAYIQAVRPTFMRTTTPDGSFDFSLPFEFPGAGGRFNRHLFPHDVYHIMKGYAADGEWLKIINAVDDMEYEIMYLGYPPNGNSGIYATRFQSPYFSHSVRMLSEKFGGDETLRRYLPALEREHEFHMAGKAEIEDAPLGEAKASRSLIRMPDGSFLNRYWDDAEGPRLESYKEDVEMGEIVVAGLTGAVRERRLQKFYKDMRSGAAGGWDYSSRNFEDGMNIETINASDIAPIDLNCLMLDSEETLAAAYAAEARAAEPGSVDAELLWLRSNHYVAMAEQRKAAINKYLWDPEDKLFRDYNFAQGRQTDVISSAMAYPLYVGMTNEEQTFGTARALRDNFLHPGGFTSTLNETGEQWDGRNVWAPPNWAASRGIARMAHILMARGVDVEELFQISEQGRGAFMHGVETAFDLFGIIPEKVNGYDPTQLAGGGEYALVKVLNMTLETYRAMKAWEPRDAHGCLPIGRLALVGQ